MSLAGERFVTFGNNLQRQDHRDDSRQASTHGNPRKKVFPRFLWLNLDQQSLDQQAAVSKDRKTAKSL